MDQAERDERWVWLAEMRGRLHRRLLPRVGPDFADDATQEALVRAAASRTTPRAEARLAWLTRIGLNWRIDRARATRNVEGLAAAEHVVLEVSGVDSVDLRAALLRLSGRDRTLLLRVARGEHYEQLAEALRISPVAVRQRVARARLRLAADLAGRSAVADKSKGR